MSVRALLALGGGSCYRNRSGYHYQGAHHFLTSVTRTTRAAPFGKGWKPVAFRYVTTLGVVADGLGVAATRNQINTANATKTATAKIGAGTLTRARQNRPTIAVRGRPIRYAATTRRSNSGDGSGAFHSSSSARSGSGSLINNSFVYRGSTEATADFARTPAPGAAVPLPRPRQRR